MALGQRHRIVNIDNCSYCNKSTKDLPRVWFSPFTPGVQCNRFWCRLRSGHFFFWNFKRTPVWLTLFDLKLLALRIPWLVKMGSHLPWSIYSPKPKGRRVRTLVERIDD